MDVKPIDSKPAPASSPRTSSWSASAIGPGAPAGGMGRSRPAAKVSRTVMIHSFFLMSCHASMASRPPERSADAMFVKAAVRSSKNITPNRLIAISKVPGSNAYTCASACRKSTFGTPSAVARRRATASIEEDRSTPSADPSCARRAASRLDCPQPQPMSSTRSARPIGSVSRNRAQIDRLVSSYSSANCVHWSPSSPSQALVMSALAISSDTCSSFRVRSGPGRMRAERQIGIDVSGRVVSGFAPKIPSGSRDPNRRSTWRVPGAAADIVVATDESFGFGRPESVPRRRTDAGGRMLTPKAAPARHREPDVGLRIFARWRPSERSRTCRG